MRKIFLTVIVFMSITTCFACDICGCSSGNYFIGPFPQFRKHFFGTRYSFRSFHSRVAEDPTQFSKDFYQTMELWGGYNLGKRWQVIGFVPYNINRQKSDDGINTSNGIGDITLLTNYKVFDKRKENKNAGMSQQLLIGGGVKLPTGKFAADPDEIIPDANNQAGTGSVDLVLNAMYTFHINDWGMNSNATYKINNSADGFKFGNRFSSSAFIFHSSSTLKTTFNPNVGVLYENLQENKLNNSKVVDTGGNALLATAGLEVIFSKLAVGFNAQLPVNENLSNRQTTTKIKGMVHVTVLF